MVLPRWFWPVVLLFVVVLVLAYCGHLHGSVAV
jgi:hypothetical protein